MRISPSPILDDEQFMLRPVELSDVDVWYGYLSLPHAIEHTSWTLASADDLCALIASYHADVPGSPIQFAIIEKATKAFVGTIGFHTISDINRTAEIAYNLHPRFWGRGIATSCCQSLVRWGLTDGGFVRIQATALDTNIASARVLQKCDFELEGKLRRFRMVRGQPRDFWVYAKTN